MGIEMIGIDHKAAEIDIRTLFSCTKRYTEDFLNYIREFPGIEGCVVLSTCNRTELWISASSTWTENLYEVFCEHRQIPAALYRDYFTFRREEEAVRHLFWLTGGLESRILGEDQILSQVRDALDFSRRHYATDHVLETLFRQAVTAAKKVKTEVALTSTDQSTVHAAIRSLKQQGMTFSEKNCLVIGNGAMGKLAATLLRKEGADVTMTVRQYHSGLVDIPADCHRIDYGRRMELLPRCDYVVSATVSPNYTLPKDLVAEALIKPVVLIDLAVPRDIDPEIKTLPGVQLFDIDSFREEAHSEEQRQAIRKAENLLTEQMEAFFIWYNCVDIVPQIEELKQRIAEDLSPRLKKELRNLTPDPKTRQQLTDDIESAAQRTANKLLFGLRDGLDPQTFRECLSCLDHIYEISPDSGP